MKIAPTRVIFLLLICLSVIGVLVGIYLLWKDGLNEYPLVSLVVAYLPVCLIGFQCAFLKRVRSVVAKLMLLGASVILIPLTYVWSYGVLSLAGGWRGVIACGPDGCAVSHDWGPAFLPWFKWRYASGVARKCDEIVIAAYRPLLKLDQQYWHRSWSRPPRGYLTLSVYVAQNGAIYKARGAQSPGPTCQMIDQKQLRLELQARKERHGNVLCGFEAGNGFLTPAATEVFGIIKSFGLPVRLVDESPALIQPQKPNAQGP